MHGAEPAVVWHPSVQPAGWPGRRASRGGGRPPGSGHWARLDPDYPRGRAGAAAPTPRYLMGRGAKIRAFSLRGTQIASQRAVRATRSSDAASPGQYFRTTLRST